MKKEINKILGELIIWNFEKFPPNKSQIIGCISNFPPLKEWKFLVGLFRRWQQLAPTEWCSNQNYQVTRKLSAPEWDKEENTLREAGWSAKGHSLLVVQEGRLCCNVVCVAEWVYGKANRRIPMKVTSVLEQGHVICTIQIHVVCKTEKKLFGNFISGKKVKGNRFILPFDKTLIYKKLYENIFKPNSKRTVNSCIITI